MQRHQALTARLAVAALLASGPAAAKAARFATIYNFVSADGGAGDANNPYAGLVIDGAGNLFGTSYAGGAGGLGTVYELSPAPGQSGWTETILYSFHASNRLDGAHPTGRLVFGQHGELYGTTSSSAGADSNGLGTVFELSPPSLPGGRWTEAILHVFTGAAGDGATPYAGLAIDSSGTLYGTTFAGGSSAGTSAPGFGTVFSLAPPSADSSAWAEAILYNFPGTARDGINPQSDLVLSPTGTLFGTTPNCSSRLACAGTVFQLAPSRGAWIESVIAAFPASGAAGAGPNRELVPDSTGNLYGTTGMGVGTTFRLSPPAAQGSKWQHNVLARFKADKDGAPQGGVLPAGAVLYGTLAYGPHKSGGAIYKVASSPGSAPWFNTTLYSFTAKPAGGGVFPVGNLVADQAGNLYGVTEIGGATGVGTVFRITP
jgi:uncharacterized repeat protein (TIGR03803 family)